jgi:2-polyprenyl-3-methyl-5-hydroxy-6-metoxy-1,4-benzoquinol methylase
MRAEEREDARYASGVGNPVELEENIMFSLLPDTRGTPMRLLDIGCGVGTISQLLAKRGFTVSGVDFSAVAIERARAAGVDAKVSDVDRDGLQYDASTFDVVWAGDVIEHVFDPINLIRESSRVLKPDGRFLFTVPNDFNLWSRLRIFLTGRAVQSEVYRKYEQCKHHTFFSWELLTYMLGRAGLKPAEVRSIYHVPKVGRTDRITHSASVGKLFGRVFIVAAVREQRA